MSQNDFTLANQSFPAFRADLNSALQALASNSSGGSAPSTTFANMWWYDTSNNIMYIRNEDNDAWIKFAELDQANDKFVLSGTLQLDDGTVSAPALTFNSDTNMGIYRGGTDILKFVTAGTDAVTIDASQDVTLAGSLNFADNEAIRFGAGQDLQLYHDASSGNSFVLEQGTGSLILQGTNIQLKATDSTSLAEFNDAGAVSLRYSGDLRLATTTTGVDVTGTLTADDKINIDASNNSRLNIKEATSSDQNTQFLQTSGDLLIRTLNDAETVATNRIVLDHSTGDISFYEDTGTTPKLFWDASEERLGIGTSSPTASLEISGTDGANNLIVGYNDTDFAIYTDSTVGEIRLKAEDGSGSNFSKFMSFYTQPSGSSAEEAMRIDSNGRALINLTGVVQSSNAKLQISNTANNVVLLNRTNDGDQITFHVNGNSASGSIGVLSSRLFIGKTDTALFFNDTSDAITPYNIDTVSQSNGEIDLGTTNIAFRNLYLSDGVVFGSTGGAVTSKTLDDYEEGTFTPVISASSSAPTVTYGSDYAKYIKIGSLVWIAVAFHTTAVTGGGGSAQIGGLPFTSTGDVYGMLNGGLVNVDVDNATYSLVARVLNSNTVARFQQYRDNTSDASITIGSLSGTVFYQFSGCYSTQ
jgi:hypothetical protein